MKSITQWWQLSTKSYASINSIGSFLSILSLYSAGSILSIGSAGSILSIGSTGSILSIGSVGSILSIGSAGGILSIGGAGRILGIGSKRFSQPTITRNATTCRTRRGGSGCGWAVRALAPPFFPAYNARNNPQMQPRIIPVGACRSSIYRSCGRPGCGAGALCLPSLLNPPFCPQQRTYETG